MNRTILAALIATNVATAAVTTSVVATPPLADLYYPYRADEADSICVVPRGACEYADGGVDADGGHRVGPRLRAGCDLVDAHAGVRRKRPQAEHNAVALLD